MGQNHANRMAPPTPSSFADGMLDLDTIAGHRVLSLLGSGTYGCVLEAECVATHTRVALKIFKTPLRADGDGRDSAWQSMATEHAALTRVGATAAIPPPGVPRLFGGGLFKASGYGGEPGGAPCVYHAWMATQLLSADMWRVFHATPKARRPDLLADVGFAALDALESLHAAGVVHRDIKPDNMCLAADTAPAGSPKLYFIDYGGCVLSAGVDDDDDDKENDAPRRRPTFMGTPHYAALAALTEEQLPCCAHDVESLALVFLEWATGRLPWGARFKSAVDAKSWTADARQEMAEAREADFTAACAAGAVPSFIQEMVTAARRAARGGGRVSFRVLRSQLRAGVEGVARAKRVRAAEY